MRILVVNAGSSSLKLSVIDDAHTTVASEELGRPGDSDTTAGLESFLRGQRGVGAVGHRIVHGGPDLADPVVVNSAVRGELDAAAQIAPLHVPAALAALDTVTKLVDAPQVACFDTAFHGTLSDVARTYAIPADWRSRGIRRYGFHGLSFAWAARRSAELLGRPQEDLRLLIAHVGSGVSVCAVDGGRSVDTSMGFTPAEGAVMATRSGSMDPGAIAWIADRERLSGAELSEILEKRSGWAALAGSSDMREIWHRAAAGDADTELARDVTVRSVAQQVAAMATALQRVDALTFTGGIGSNLGAFRSRVVRRLACLGFGGDSLPDAPGDAVLRAPAANPGVLSVVAREDLEIAREVEKLLGG